jgi:uncharacterized membrane protein (UPF0136 family)
LAGRLKREVLWLIGGVVLVDVVFVAGYFLSDIRNTSDGAKLAFTVLWTLVTLAVVLRGLARIRRVRLDGREIRP